MTQPWDIYEISQNNLYLTQRSGFQMDDDDHDDGRSGHPSALSQLKPRPLAGQLGPSDLQNDYMSCFAVWFSHTITPGNPGFPNCQHQINLVTKATYIAVLLSLSNTAAACLRSESDQDSQSWSRRCKRRQGIISKVN